LDSCEFDIDSATETPSAAWNALDCDGDGVINGTEVTDVNNRTVTPSAEWEALDCDNDGNPNGTDPNTFTAVAEDDNTSADIGMAKTTDVLFNDDFIPGTGKLER